MRFPAYTPPLPEVAESVAKEDAMQRVRPPKHCVYPGRRGLSDAERHKYHGYIHAANGCLYSPDCVSKDAYADHRRAGRVVLRPIESRAERKARLEVEALAEVEAMLNAKVEGQP